MVFSGCFHHNPYFLLDKRDKDDKISFNLHHLISYLIMAMKRNSISSLSFRESLVGGKWQIRTLNSPWSPRLKLSRQSGRSRYRLKEYITRG